MTTKRSSAWLVVHVERDRRRNFFLAISDARGAGRRPSPKVRPRRQGFDVVGQWRGRAIFAPVEFERIVRQHEAAFSSQGQGLLPGAPASLPVFVDAVDVPEATQVVRRVLSSFLPKDRFQIVRLGTARAERQPFRLPLTVTSVDEPEVLEPLRSEFWTNAEPEFGLRLDTVSSRDVDESLRSFRDVVVVKQERLGKVVDSIAGLPIDQRPRVVVSWGSGSESSSGALPAGVAMVRLRGSEKSAGTWLRHLVEGVVHDQPLHEAVSTVSRLDPVAGGRIELVADPGTNDTIRMVDAYTGIVEEALALEARTPAGGREVIDHFGDRARAAIDGLKGGISKVLSLPPDFTRETAGLLPLADAERSLEEARKSAAQLAPLIGEMVLDPKVAATVESEQPRSVDVRLRRRDAPTYTGSATEFVWVGRHVALRAGAPYVLQVQVGAPHLASLLERPAPPIDKLLPPPQGDGHQLDVVLFPLDFAATSAASCVLKLPRLGPSEQVAFDVRAPLRTGSARLRVCVYFRDHLVQSLLLRTEVAPEEQARPEVTTSVEVEFSRSERLTDLDALAPRSLSLAVNESASGTHQLMFKRGGRFGAVPFTEQHLSDQTSRLRQRLLEASLAEKGERFAVEGTISSEHSRAEIHELAKLGRHIRDGLFNQGSDALGEVVREIAGGRGETIQVLRHKPTYVLPWSLLYDFRLPDSPEPICTGELPDRPGVRCDHSLDNPGYCIFGFWGVRHRIEELIRATDGTKPPPLPRERLRLALGVQDAFTASLEEELKNLAPSALVAHTDTHSLAEPLWNDAMRPSELIVLGHLEVVDAANGVMRIASKKATLLSTTELTDRIIADGSWKSPRPLVLLMGCATGAMTLSTLNDLMLSVARAGASAVVGTECDCYSPLVAKFASEITRRLWHGETLGEAIRSFREELLRMGNPLAFVFTAVGDADVHFAPEVQ